MTKFANVKPGTVFCFSDCPLSLCLRMQGRGWVQLPQASYLQVSEGDKWMDRDVLELGAFDFQAWSSAVCRYFVRGDQRFSVDGKRYVVVEDVGPPPHRAS